MFRDPGLRSLHSLALGYVVPPRWVCRKRTACEFHAPYSRFSFLWLSQTSLSQ